jgi:hypothetical protein
MHPLARIGLVRPALVRPALAAALAALALAPLAAGAQERADSTFRWAGRIPEGSWLRIHNLNGEVAVEAGEGNEVEVVGEKYWRRGDPREVRFELVRDGDNVTICALWRESATCDEDGAHYPRRDDDDDDDRRRRNDVSVDFKVRLPRGVKVHAATVNGSVDVRGARAEVVASSVNGRVDAATSAGPVDATTVNGAVRVRMESLAGSGDMRFSTVNGSVTVEGPPTLDAEVEMETVNGSVRSDYPLTVNGRFSPRRLRATIGKGGRRIELKTVNGSLELRKL